MRTPATLLLLLVGCTPAPPLHAAVDYDFDSRAAYDSLVRGDPNEAARWMTELLEAQVSQEHRDAVAAINWETTTVDEVLAHPGLLASYDALMKALPTSPVASKRSALTNCDEAKRRLAPGIAKSMQLLKDLAKARGSFATIANVCGAPGTGLRPGQCVVMGLVGGLATQAEVLNAVAGAAVTELAIGMHCQQSDLKCGDGICFKEDQTSCPEDCGAPPTLVCGDGKWETGEDCDDGNVVDGDGCSSVCKKEGTGSCGLPCKFKAKVNGQPCTAGSVGPGGRAQGFLMMDFGSKGTDFDLRFGVRCSVPGGQEYDIFLRLFPIKGSLSQQMTHGSSSNNPVWASGQVMQLDPRKLYCTSTEYWDCTAYSSLEGKGSGRIDLTLAADKKTGSVQFNFVTATRDGVSITVSEGSADVVTREEP